GGSLSRSEVDRRQCANAVHRLLRLTIRGPLAQAGGTTPPLCTASARARAEVDGVDAVQGENSRKAGREAATTLRADASGLPGRPGRAGESGQPELASTAWQARLCQASHSASAASPAASDAAWHSSRKASDGSGAFGFLRLAPDPCSRAASNGAKAW